MDMKQKAYVESLLEKAQKAPNGGEAMHFTQAACNAANAVRLLIEVERLGPIKP